MSVYILSKHILQLCNYIQTNQYERHSNHKSENVSSDWLIVFSISFGKEVEPFIDVVLAKSLIDKSEFNSAEQ